MERWKPAVANRWLFLISGIVWTGMGVWLCGSAYRALEESGVTTFVPVVLAGLLLALAFYRLSFFRIVRKNTHRIGLMRDKVCVFAFQDTRSYFVAAFMAGLGITLRALPLPKPYVALVYLGVGGALLFASLHYYPRVLRGPLPKAPR